MSSGGPGAQTVPSEEGVLSAQNISFAIFDNGPASAEAQRAPQPDMDVASAIGDAAAIPGLPTVAA
jgi:hypothetical protein